MRSTLPNLDGLQEHVDLAKKFGFLCADVNVPKYADLTLAKEAAKPLAAANH
jgi:hypothetical protein